MPEQPLKAYPTAIVVRTSFEETVNAMDAPCAVVPLHCPTLSDESDGDAGPLLHADASTPATVPIRNSAFVFFHMSCLAAPHDHD